MRIRISFVHACLAVFSIVLIMSTAAYAQGVTITGTVDDESQSVLPGVTMTATSVETGRQFTAVTDERGEYRLVGLTAGRYSLQADLSGFAALSMSNIELLVGQNATIPLTLKLAGFSENMTVTGEAPLVDVNQARVAGNVDRRQMEELPIAGRNWQQLASMVKGITANTITSRPGVNRDSVFSLNVDGQQISQNLCCGGGMGQPGISRDAIAEFQVITNLFDVTMGRSTGIQVQAVSRAGSNNLDGSFYGNFRSDRFNSTDAFAGRVLPYSNRQVGGTLGGPIKRDTLQYFLSYEYEAEPSTTILAPNALLGQRFEIAARREIHSALGRADYQITPVDHLTLRSGYWSDVLPGTASGHPSRLSDNAKDSNYTSLSWSRVGSQNRLHELKTNYYHYHFLLKPADGIPLVPHYNFPGLSLGPPGNYPEDWYEDLLTTRYDLTLNKGRHDFKIGGEARVGADKGWWLHRARGRMYFSALPADASRRFPADAATDPSRWDLTGLDRLGLTYEIAYAELGGGVKGYGNYSFDIPRPMVAGWIGDTWKATDLLTFNLGVRYDVAWQDVSPPGLTETELWIDNGRDGLRDYGYRNDIRDLNNVAPRAGFAWNVTGSNDFVIRGGTGLYYSQPSAESSIEPILWNGQRVVAVSYVNDGQPGWVLDPTRGVTAAEVLSGAVPRPPQAVSVIGSAFRFPYAWQNMLGFQKQLGALVAVDADLVHYKGYNEPTARDPNRFYDAATGLPKDANVFGRPTPAYGPIEYIESQGHSDYLALATSMRRRYRDNVQFGATYTLMFYKNDNGVSDAAGYLLLNPFDASADWGRSADFQRHTARGYGIWNLPMGFSLSGSFLYGSGNYSTTSTNVDMLGSGVNRVRRDLSIIPRNGFADDPFQTLDVRVSKDFSLGGDVKLTGIAEMFNVYSYARYSRNTLETSSNFGKPNGSGIQPRTGQLAFRLSF